MKFSEICKGNLKLKTKWPSQFITTVSLTYVILSKLILPIVMLLLTSLIPSKCLSVCLCPNHRWEYRFPRAGDKLECRKKYRQVIKATAVPLPFKRNRLTNEMKCRGWENHRPALFTLYYINRLTVSSNVSMEGGPWQPLSVNLWAYWNPPGMNVWKVHHSTRETNVSWHTFLGSYIHKLISHLIICFLHACTNISWWPKLKLYHTDLSMVLTIPSAISLTSWSHTL